MLHLKNLSSQEITTILDQAQEIANGKRFQANEPIFVANLFFENSTRTKVSFEMAERKLGLNIIPFDISQSSVNKGESLYDTLKTLQSIGIDLAVMRHSQNEFYKDLEGIDIGIINGGDGTGNHPTQSILDLMTIRQEFGHFEGLKIGIVGDILHSRVAHSTSKALQKIGAEVYFSAPKEWQEKDGKHYHDLDEIIPEMDVIMLLRIQHERHDGQSQIENYLQKYGLTKEREKMMKPNAIIMHPAPINRGVEIDTELVECPRSRIFKQMENGVFARMAILKNVLEKRGFLFNQ